MPVIYGYFGNSPKKEVVKTYDLNYFGVTVDPRTQTVVPVEYVDLPESEKNTKQLYISESAVKYAASNSNTNREAARFLHVSLTDWNYWASHYTTEEGITYQSLLKRKAAEFMKQHASDLNARPTTQLVQKLKHKTRQIGRIVTQEYRRYKNSVYFKKWYHQRLLKKPPRDYTKNKNLYTGRKFEDALANKYPDYDWNRFTFELIQRGLLKEECCRCGFSSRRVMDGHPPLRLHLKNQNTADHSLENVELYCFNCYFLYIGNISGRFAGVIRNREDEKLASESMPEVPAGKKLKNSQPYIPQDKTTYIQDWFVPDVPKKKYPYKKKTDRTKIGRPSPFENVDPSTIKKYEDHDLNYVESDLGTIKVDNDLNLNRRELLGLYATIGIADNAEEVLESVKSLKEDELYGVEDGFEAFLNARHHHHHQTLDNTLPTNTENENDTENNESWSELESDSE